MIHPFAAASPGERALALIGEYLHNISRLPELLREDPLTFWLISASLLVIVLLVVLLVVAGSRRRSRRRRVEEDHQRPKVFVPVESSGADIDTILLPLDQRIAACRGGLDQDTAGRILQHSPRSLADIVTAYDKCQSAVQTDLSRLVREARLMENYCARLGEEQYSQGVLVDAWARFPDNEVLRGFVELLASPDEAVQMRGVRLLSAIQEPKTLSMMMMALVQPERYVPARVAEVFISMPQQSGPLLAYMLPEIDEKYKQTVLDIIAQTRATFPPENVVACLRHHSFHVRAAAATALGESRMSEPVPELIIAANDRRWQVRAAAAKALGQIGDMRGITILEALSQDKEGWVAANAEEALKTCADLRDKR